MFPLDRRSRGALVGASLCCYAAAATALPQSARGRTAPDPAPGLRASLASEPLPTRPPVVLPRRDPFAGHDDTIAVSPEPAPSALALAVPAPRIGTLPPASAGTVPDFGDRATAGAVAGAGAPLQPAAVVRAVGLGARPVALILVAGGADRVVEIGDVVDGRRVATIAGAGVTLDDGTLLPLADRRPGDAPRPQPRAAPATPAPSPSAEPAR